MLPPTGNRESPILFTNPTVIALNTQTTKRSEWILLSDVRLLKISGCVTCLFIRHLDFARAVEVFGHF